MKKSMLRQGFRGVDAGGIVMFFAGRA